MDKRSEAYKTHAGYCSRGVTPDTLAADWTINFERVADALNLVDQGKKVEEDYEKLTEQTQEGARTSVR